jgi:TRAP-type transport system small permease protein
MTEVLFERPAPHTAHPLVRRLEAIQGAVLGMLIFAMMALTFVDVVGRSVLGAPLAGAYEITVLLLGATVYVALPLTVLREEHVTVSLLNSVFRGRVKRFQSALVNVLGACIMALVAWRLWMQGAKLSGMGNRMTFLDVPTAPVIYVMSVMAFIAVALHLVVASRYALGRGP